MIYDVIHACHVVVVYTEYATCHGDIIYSNGKYLTSYEYEYVRTSMLCSIYYVLYIYIM